MGNIKNEIEEYQSAFALSWIDFIKQYKIKEENITYNVGYEKLKDLKRIYQPETIEGCFFFSNQKLELIYLSDADYVQKLWDKFMENIIEPKLDKRMRSRAGKRASHTVFAEKGFAASTEGRKVRFIEIFPPQTIEKYLATIYKEPRPFIK